MTMEGETVWEFHAPEISPDRSRRAAFYRMMRITDVERYPFLKALKTE